MSLQESLESFLRDEISLGQLIRTIEQIPATGADASAEAVAVLDAAFGGGRLPESLRNTLLAPLESAALTALGSGESIGMALDAASTQLQGMPDTATELFSPATVAFADMPTHVIASSVAKNDGAVPTRLGADDGTVVLSADPSALDDGATEVVAAAGGNRTSALGSTDSSRLGTVNLAKITTGGIAPDLLQTLAGENLTASADLAPDQDLCVGVVLKDRFVLKEMLGRGGMGAVFKALDLRKVEANDRDPFVALKVLNRDFSANPVSFMALQREAKRAQTLSHPNIIIVYDFDRDGTRVFMSMEHLQGQPLSQLIRNLPEGGMTLKQAWPLIEAMGEALAYAHRKNIVHSDFKPGNVFITGQNETKVLDFGIASAFSRPGQGGADATVFNARDLGAMTPAYASLEQLRYLPPDPRDDLYALACVSYELLTGKHPFGRLSAEKALELKLQPKAIPGLGHREWKTLQHGLAFQQQDRIASAGEFLQGLRPRSKLYYVAWAAALLAVIATGGNLYFHLLAPPAAPPPIVAVITPEQQQKINDLLDLAAMHFEVGYLTAPTGSNALWAYLEVLKIDPYNEKAVSGLKKIADAEEQAAWEFYEKGDRAQSLKKVLEGLEANPRHEGLLKLKSKLEG